MNPVRNSGRRLYILEINMVVIIKKLIKTGAATQVVSASYFNAGCIPLEIADADLVVSASYF